MLELNRARELGAREDGLAVVVTSRTDGSAHASVVNAGVLDHPVTGEPVVGLVARGGTRKLIHLRMRPRLTVVFRSGWDWLAVEGDADLAGPDDRFEGLEAADVPRLLREIYAAAVGGSEDHGPRSTRQCLPNDTPPYWFERPASTRTPLDKRLVDMRSRW